MKIKKILVWLIIIILIIGGYYFLVVKKSTDKEEAKEEISKKDLTIQNIKSKYQITGDKEEPIYTIQAQKQFITNKPSLFEDMHVDDILNRDGKIFIQFSSFWNFYNNYFLELECDKETTDRVLSQKEKGFSPFGGEYAVVANIKEVIKPIFALKGSNISTDEAEINIETSTVLILKGTCIDIIYIDEEE